MKFRIALGRYAPKGSIEQMQRGDEDMPPKTIKTMKPEPYLSLEQNFHHLSELKTKYEPHIIKPNSYP